MPDYKNGKIYQIVCNETGETYIGSTAVSLEDRLKRHKRPSNECCSKQIIERGKYYIELLETYPCNNEFELKLKEGEYQRAIECINICIIGRTHKEWVQDNKKYRTAQLLAYRNKTKEYKLINGRKEVNCECGSKITYNSLTRHRSSKKHINLMANL